jgi:hypothetical protein
MIGKKRGPKRAFVSGFTDTKTNRAACALQIYARNAIDGALQLARVRKA